MRLLSRDELDRLRPAETHAFPGPVPTQIVSSEEYFPLPQSGPQREAEAHLRALGDELGRRQGLSRRAFFRTASGMAASPASCACVRRWGGPAGILGWPGGHRRSRI